MSGDGQARARAPRSPEDIRAEIERTRQELAVSVSALREEVAWRTDWREWVRRRPLVCVGAAFAVGFLLGTRGSSRSLPHPSKSR